MLSDDIVYLTGEGLDKLTKELEYLKNIKRKEVSKRIQEAKEYGDLSENAEYAEAKDEQAVVETRIMELENLIKNSQVIQSSKKGDIVRIGSVIKVTINGGEKTYSIVGSQEADPLNGKISNESPLGKAFLGKKIGDSVSVRTPGGTQEFVIRAIS